MAISTTHLLLGLTRESTSRASRLQSLQARIADLHGLIGTPANAMTRRNLKLKQQVLLDNDTKKALAYAAIEAGSDWRPIDTDTLLLGILSFANEASLKLQDLGINLHRARLEVQELEKISPRRSASLLTILLGSSREIRNALSALGIVLGVLLLFVVLIRWINR